MNYSKSIKFWGSVVVSFYTGIAFAGAPFVTDDPEPVAAQKWEVNYATTKTWRNDSSSMALPTVDINYGFAQDIQLHLQPRYSYEKNTAQHAYGLDNTEVGVKYRFLTKQFDTGQLMVGIYPKIQIPSGNTNLGQGRNSVQSYLPAWLQYDSGSWTMYGGIGYRENVGLDSKNSWFSGVTVLNQVTPKLKIGGEVYQETSTQAGQSATSGFNLGGVYNFTPDYHLLFSGGKGLSNISASGNLSLYLALQVIY